MVRLFSFILFLSLPIISTAAEMFGEKMYKSPVREISIIITDDGYYPNKISAFEGEKVRFFVTSTATEKQCFILQRHELFLGVDKGKVNEGEILLDRPGRFKFYCPSNKMQGHLTVIKKTIEIQEAREPAGVSKPTYWVPRNNEGEY